MPGGHTGIRDPNVTRLRDLPGYTRAGFLAAVQDELRALTDNFPRQFVQIGFWNAEWQDDFQTWHDLLTNPSSSVDIWRAYSRTSISARR